MISMFFGSIKDGNAWRIRSNIEIEQLYHEKDTINSIKIRRIQWLCHLIRISYDRNTKKIYIYNDKLTEEGILVGPEKYG